MDHIPCSKMCLCSMVGLVFLGLGAAVACADEDESPLQAGAWALQFSIAENFTLESFDGAAISIKRHFSPQSAVRVGLTGNLADRSSDEYYEHLYNDQKTSHTDASDRNARVLYVNAAYMYYARAATAVHLALQLGPELGFGRAEDTATNWNGARYVHTNKGWSAGLAGSAGVEWTPTRSFGFHAEYGVAAYYWSESDVSQSLQSETNYDISDRDSHGITLASRGVRLGLSVYF